MNKNSLLKLISLFFVFVFLLINALFFVMQESLFAMEQKEQMRRFFTAQRLLHEQKEVFQELMIEPVTDIAQEELLKSGTILLELPFVKMILYKKRTFFLSVPPPPPPPHIEQLFFASKHMPPKDMFAHKILEDVAPKSAFSIWILFAFADLLLLLFFAYLVKKLLPLYRLKNAIRGYKDGDVLLHAPTDMQDEIAQITTEFNLVLKKIASIKEARTLFMRNVFHELKTPIMKGLLIVDSLKSEVRAQRLQKIFYRMSYLLEEFSKIERFGSGEWELHISKYRFADLLEGAYDILMCKEDAFDVTIEEVGGVLSVDFELFCIALKNLLDNALKYSHTKPVISFSGGKIVITNDGDAIDASKRDFSKPFNRSYETSSAGLGLGLYLTNSIAQKHGFRFAYRYENGMNIFEINTDVTH